MFFSEESQPQQVASAQEHLENTMAWTILLDFLMTEFNNLFPESKELSMQETCYLILDLLVAKGLIEKNEKTGKWILPIIEGGVTSMQEIVDSIKSGNTSLDFFLR